ncbi:MAG: hypothetical protein K9I68_10810 [Bacteroidales bacterium]|nr:hypothetical protein [Bacteroidales bacterium]MCF8339064.1 hypothetical protein [Bacteroidales bacterium]
MKALKYISGFSGAVLLIYWLLGIIFDFHVSFYFLIGGLILFGLIYFPLALLDKHRRENRWDTIRDDQEKQPHSQKKRGKKTKRKGYGVSGSPYRERSSGLRWEGGSVYGANAKRGSRRSFLRRK